jgi:hypothetical protein
MANGDIEATSTATSSTAVATSPAVASSGAVGVAGASSGINSLQFGVGGAKFPLANALHKYASMTYIFTLAALSKEDIADPEKTYMAGTKVPIVLKTAGGSPTNRIKTKFGQFEFYMDDLSINTVYGLLANTGNSNAQTMKCTIIEPYSMGMLTIALNQAAFQAGYTAGFRECIFLLKIEFKGADQNGSMVNVPGTTKFLPVKFQTLNMTVTEGGASYACALISQGTTVFAGSNTTITSDITITGSSVAEILQTGPNSLQAVLNRRLQDVAKKNQIPVPDEVVILFPADSTGVAVQKGEDEKMTNKPATAPVVAPGNNSRVFSVLGVSRSKVNNSLVQSQINEIGAVDLGYSETRQPKSSAVDPSKVYNSAGYLEPSKVTVNPKISDYVFKQSSSIQNAINQVILTSDYGKKALKDDPDNLGFRTWWRIEPAMYHIDDAPTLKKIGRYPQIMVYKVVPYKVHATNQPVPGAKSTKFSALLNQCVKIYNYIYTGKNSDILNFKLNFDNRFMSVLAPDAFGKSGSTAQAAADDAATEKKYSIRSWFGSLREQSEGHNNVAVTNAMQAKTAGKGSGGVELPEHTAARIFHDAITNGIDLQIIELEIVGDPYWLASSGWGNYNARPTTFLNISKDGSVNWQNGEVDMAINFSTPIDINPVTGLYTMAGKRSAQFSGLYRVQTVEHIFRDGQFTQIIKANRRQISKSDTEDVVASTKQRNDLPPEGSK